MDALGAAFIAMPGHKGLYGPQGTGLLLCGAEPEPLLRGGTGSQSILQEMPEELPDRLEAGTHNMPGIAGLLEGLRFVEQQGVGRIAGHERHLTRHMAALLRDIPGAEVFYTPEDGAQTGVLKLSPGRLGTARRWAKLLRRRARRCGRDSTVRLWRTARRERWRRAPCGAAFRPLTPPRRWSTLPYFAANRSLNCKTVHIIFCCIFPIFFI